MDLYNSNITSEGLLRTTAFSTVMTKLTDTTRMLDSSSSYFHVYDGTSTAMIMPNATTLFTGHQYYIANDSTTQISALNYDSTQILPLNPGTRTRLTLKDNTSTAGAWVYESNAASSVSSYSIFGSYTGHASGRYLDIYPGTGSDTAPYITVTNMAIVALTLGAVLASTGTAIVYKNGDFVTPIASISLSASTVAISTSLYVRLNQGDTITLYISGTGSINKPRFTVYFTGR